MASRFAGAEVPIGLEQQGDGLDRMLERLRLVLAQPRLEEIEERQALAVGRPVDQRRVQGQRRRRDRARRADRAPEIGTLEVAGDALDGAEEERLVPLERSAEGPAELLAMKILELAAVRQVAGQPLEPLEMEDACRARSLVPDLVITLTTPPAVRPNSAGAPLAITWNSFTASSVMSIGARWPPTCSPKKPLLKSPPSRLMLLKTPRWPANVISSPSGPCTTLTPGVSVSRSSNLRPRIGVFSIVGLIQRAGDRRAGRLDQRGPAHRDGLRDVRHRQPRREVDRLAHGQIDVVLDDGARSRRARTSPCSGPTAAAGTRSGHRRRWSASA